MSEAEVCPVDLLVIEYTPWPLNMNLPTPSALGYVVCDSGAVNAMRRSGWPIRVADPSKERWRAGLPSGLYTFTEPGHDSPCYALAIADGVSSGPGRREYLKNTDDGDPLVQALSYFNTATTAALAISPRFEPGDRVLKKSTSDVGEVVSVTDAGGSVLYRVRFGIGPAWVCAQDDLVTAPAPDEPDHWIRGDAAGPEGVSLALTLAKLGTALTDTVYSFQTSRTVFRPYQFRPVLRLLASDRHRLLIADEVGLGKTIEAGLVWNELEQRTHMRNAGDPGSWSSFRTLVVCPASLKHKWIAEMRGRFDRHLVELDAKETDRFVQKLADDTEEPLAAVISLERLRGGEVLQRMANARPRFDLVIVDEAHSMRNRGSRSHMAGSLLSDWSDALVLLSATPLNLGHDDLFNLLHLLDPQSFPDSRIFQGQVGPNQRLNEIAKRLAEGADREPGGTRRLIPMLDGIRDMDFGRAVADSRECGEVRRLLDVVQPLTAGDLATAKRALAELNVLASVVSRTRKADVPDAKAKRVPEDVEVVWSDRERDFYNRLREACALRARRAGTASPFASQMWLRQAASCIPAMQERLRELIKGDVRDEYEWEAGTALGADADDKQATASSAREPEDLSEFVALMPALGHDTKAERFVELLSGLRKSGMRQVMVFSYFRRTLDYLAKQLHPDFSVRVMHGLTPQPNRAEIIDDFRAGKFDILLVSEVGSEGLDFEFCNALVNYDLPWNPMKVEQRIGRLDRFGQRHEKIFIFNMSVPGTIEADIFLRLYQRIGVFHDTIGPLEPILRGKMKQLHRIVMDPSLNPQERDEQVRRIDIAGVAQARDIQELKEADFLTGMDDLLVEGFETDSPGGGRYVGTAELRILMERFLADSRSGALKPVDGDHEAGDLVGSPALDNLIAGARSAGFARQLRGSDLAKRIRYQEPVRVSFASRRFGGGAEFLNIRHPLIGTARWYFREHPELRPRFGTVAMEGCGPHQSLVLITLMTTAGTRPRRELWTSAVDVDTLLPAPQVGTALLAAHARGALTASSLATRDPVVVRRALEEAVNLADIAQVLSRDRFDAENRRVTESRLEAVERNYRLKIDMAIRIAAEVGDEGVARMQNARAKNLAVQRDQELSQRRDASEFSMDAVPVAVVLVSGS